MRELRQDVSYNLEAQKDELDQIDEFKIEEVLMGFKGLKQEEVFSFLSKSNFTPAEIEEWLKTISSAGLGSYDQLTSSVGTSEMEQSQINFNMNYEGMHSNYTHSIPTNSYIFKRIKPKTQTIPVCDDQTANARQQRYPRACSRFGGIQDYLSLNYPVGTLREEEIVATNIAEEMICTTKMGDEEEYKSPQPNNTYVIQTPMDGLGIDKVRQPIKLLIKRMESEDETSEIPSTRGKSKRTRQPSVRLEEISPPPKRRRCVKKTSMNKAKSKNTISTNTKRRESLLDETDFPLVNSIQRDDDYDLSDEEDDVYSFSQGDDETWTPKMKMKMNNLKNERPARDRKQNHAVAKFLEAAALKQADSHAFNIATNLQKMSKKKSLNIISQKPKLSGGIGDLIIDEDYRRNRVNLLDNTYLLPSTSTSIYSSVSLFNVDYQPPIRVASSPDSKKSMTPTSTPRKVVIRTKKKGIQKIRRIIPPKTCKLLQVSSDAKQSDLSLQLATTKKSVQNDLSMTNCCASNSEKKSTGATYITKRGKPKKGMATAKQRLGKILKMHKMFF